MSSPSRTNDLQDEHCPSLQPCMSMIPCSAAARRTVWSSSTSISMPTGSNRTTCLSLIPTSVSARCHRGRGGGPGLGLRGGPRLSSRACLLGCSGCRSAGPPFSAVSAVLLSRRSAQLTLSSAGVRRRWPAGRAAADVVRVERLALRRCHLVEQHVRALHRRHPPQVVERPQDRKSTRL